MDIGISLYPGCNNTFYENMELLKNAASLGYKMVFTSLQLPEVIKNRKTSGAEELFRLARELGLKVMADISPEARAFFGGEKITPDLLLNCGISAARFDFGATKKDIGTFAAAMPVSFNASTVTEKELRSFVGLVRGRTEILGLHNYYPRPHTGLSESFVRNKNALMQSFGIRCGAFLSCRTGRRGPLFEGLPTVEHFRDASPETAAKRLAQLGCDLLVISEEKPDLRDLKRLALAALPLCAEDAGTVAREVHIGRIRLHVELLSEDPLARKLVETCPAFTARRDAAEECIRLAEGRTVVKDAKIEPADDGTHPDIPGSQENGIIPRGAVTLDNDLYGRYKGELQIILKDMPADKRTNVIGRIWSKDERKLDNVPPGARIVLRTR